MKTNRARYLSCILASILIAAFLPMSASAASFSDVPSNAWYAPYVKDLTDRGVINGTSPTTFSPSNKLTRAAFVTMIAKTVLTKEELSQYAYKGKFKDVSPSHWYNPYINWAAETGVVNGYENGTFQPKRAVTRQEMAKMVTNFSWSFGRQMTPSENAVVFTDANQISAYAKESVAQCQRSGIISGYTDGSFKPKNTATRAEAASLYSKFLGKCPVTYQITRKRVDNIPIKAIEFDPSQYQADVVMGRDLVDGAESAASMISRSGAKIAVNAAFFDMDSYVPYATIIKNGRVVTIDNSFAPEKSSFTMDFNGHFTVEHFSTWYTAVRTAADGTEETVNKVSVNKWPSGKTDATRILFTRDWGHTLCFSARDAITVDKDGSVIAVTQNKDVDIPALDEGYVLAQGARRYYEGNFFLTCQIGDHIELQHSYEGASTQDIRLSVSAGPCLVKGGAAYGGKSTYQDEGFFDPNITTYSAVRMAIGIKPNGHLILVNATCTLPQLSSIFVKLGCSDAMNLDGGGSANLYAGGRWLCGPQSRALNNMLVFK